MMLLEKMQMALEGTYHPQSYSDLDLDLATTIYELGGGTALYALHVERLSQHVHKHTTSGSVQLQKRLTRSHQPISPSSANCV